MCPSRRCLRIRITDIGRESKKLIHSFVVRGQEKLYYDHKLATKVLTVAEPRKKIAWDLGLSNYKLFL